RSLSARLRRAPLPPRSPYTTLFRSVLAMVIGVLGTTRFLWARAITTVFVETFRGIAALVVMFWFVFAFPDLTGFELDPIFAGEVDRKSTRLNSSHVSISYAVFCLRK